MTPRIIPTLVLTVALQTLVPVGAHAEKAKQPARPPGKMPEKKATPAQVHTTISSISADSITITDAKGDKTYKVTKDTDIELKGQKVTADQLKAGMRVSVSMSSDPTVASRISASDAPKDAPAAGDKKK